MIKKIILDSQFQNPQYIPNGIKSEDWLDNGKLFWLYVVLLKHPSSSHIQFLTDEIKFPSSMSWYISPLMVPTMMCNTTLLFSLLFPNMMSGITGKDFFFVLSDQSILFQIFFINVFRHASMCSVSAAQFCMGCRNRDDWGAVHCLFFTVELVFLLDHPTTLFAPSP